MTSPTSPIIAHVGEAPGHVLTWTSLVMTHGIPPALKYEIGLYAVTRGDQLLYVGRSRSLARRLGQLIGALCGGRYGLHSGGHRILDRWSEVPQEGETTIFVWTGNKAYNAEKAILSEGRLPLGNAASG
jgi:hypothetical protein